MPALVKKAISGLLVCWRYGMTMTSLRAPRAAKAVGSAEVVLMVCPPVSS
jgi:hypothetical protein